MSTCGGKRINQGNVDGRNKADDTIQLCVIGYHVNCQYGKYANFHIIYMWADCLLEVTAGRVGVHQWDLPLSHILSNKWLVVSKDSVSVSYFYVLIHPKPSYIGVILMPPAATFIKLTFYLMYLHIFRPLKWLRICIYLGATATTAFYVGTEIYWLASITPRKGQTFADVAISPAEFKSLALSVPVACVELGTDLYLLVLPITAVLHLQLPTRRKVGVIVIFMTGIAWEYLGLILHDKALTLCRACISSILAIYYRVLLNRNDDYTWNLLPVNIAS